MVESVFEIPELNEERKSTRIDIKLIHKLIDVGHLNEPKPTGNVVNVAGSRLEVTKQSVL